MQQACLGGLAPVLLGQPACPLTPVTAAVLTLFVRAEFHPEALPELLSRLLLLPRQPAQQLQRG
jgi:hypothetical protein